MIVEINGNTYSGSRRYMEVTLLRMARESVVGTDCIFAIEKGEEIIMIKQPHESSGSLLESVEKYESEGYKVHYTTRK